MAKAPDAFRTISEVSAILDTPAHVLRFWESKFNQIKPIKRAGSRRYYRPEDVSLLAGIKTLLHEQGMTIKGAQKLLREKGVKHVQAVGSEKTSAEPEVKVAVPETPEIKTPEPTPEPAAPKLEISNITAFRPRPAEETAEKSTPELPSNPVSAETQPPRFFGGASRISDEKLRAKAAQIAPLLARLETVRDQMRRV